MYESFQYQIQYLDHIGPKHYKHCTSYGDPSILFEAKWSEVKTWTKLWVNIKNCAIIGATGTFLKTIVFSVCW